MILQKLTDERIYENIISVTAIYEKIEKKLVELECLYPYPEFCWSWPELAGAGRSWPEMAGAGEKYRKGQ